jgi:hypothetical protein
LFLLFCLDEALRICCLFAGARSDVVFRLDLPLQMEKQLLAEAESLNLLDMVDTHPSRDGCPYCCGSSTPMKMKPEIPEQLTI